MALGVIPEVECMMKVIAMVRRRAGMTASEFREYYERNHVPLAHQYLGHLFTGYRRNYVDIADTRGGGARNPGNAASNLDAVTEIWLKNEDAWDEMRRILSDPVMGPIFREDERRFMEQSALTVFPVTEVASPEAAMAGEVG